jgi:hypothetical protein
MLQPISDRQTIRTPESYPDHDVIGRWFVSHDGKIYYCDSQDYEGYWMTEENGTDRFRRTNISTGAVNRTFHRIHEEGHCAFPEFGNWKGH